MIRQSDVMVTTGWVVTALWVSAGNRVQLLQAELNIHSSEYCCDSTFFTQEWLIGRLIPRSWSGDADDQRMLIRCVIVATDWL